MTREEWLSAAVEELRPSYVAAGFALPPHVRVTVGFPSSRAISLKSRAIGECWAPAASADGSSHLFVSPVLGDAPAALAVLVHELSHAAAGTEHGHKGAFRRCAVALGLCGKMTSTKAGPELAERLNVLSGKLGAYPHSPLDPSLRTKKKQTTRMHKATCSDCSYVIRVAAKWIESAGLPDCKCGGEFEVAE